MPSTAAVANNGERHSASILKSIRNYDYSEKVYERQDEVLSTVESPQTTGTPFMRA
ncbi:MAG: hypothetical protein V8S72_00620 [Oscillospiraceae bacterium]